MTTAASAARTRRTMVRARADRGCPPPRRRSAVERWLRDARAGSRDRRAGGTRGTAGARRPAAILLAATARRGDAGGCAGRDGGALRARRDAPARRGARLRLVDGATLEPWVEGASFFPRILADVDAARSSVQILMFGWREGDVGTRMAALLERKLADGVEVRVIVD